MDETQNFWKKCSNCKKSLLLGTPYYRCSVSTCNHERTGLQFCSVSCWSAHVPIYRHRESWAIEEIAPKIAMAESHSASAASDVKKVMYTGASASIPSIATSHSSSSNLPDDVLVVVSKLKAYIKAKSDMNTSADVMDTLSDQIRRICDEAIVRARSDGRKTLMARDFAGAK